MVSSGIDVKKLPARELIRDGVAVVAACASLTTASLPEAFASIMSDDALPIAAPPAVKRLGHISAFGGNLDIPSQNVYLQQKLAQIYSYQNQVGRRGIDEVRADLEEVTTLACRSILGEERDFSSLELSEFNSALVELTQEFLKEGYYFTCKFIGTEQLGYFASVSLYQVGDPIEARELPIIDLPLIRDLDRDDTVDIYESKEVVLDRYSAFPGNRLQPGGKTVKLAGIPVITPEGYDSFIIVRPDIIADVAIELGIPYSSIYEESIENELAHFITFPLSKSLPNESIFTIVINGGASRLEVYPYHIDEAISDYWSLGRTANLETLIRGRYFNCPSGYELSQLFLQEAISNVLRVTGNESAEALFEDMQGNEDLKSLVLGATYTNYRDRLNEMLSQLEKISQAPATDSKANPR